MRCTCCNRNLNDYESTLKRADNGEYIDICMTCLEDIPIEYVGREDLNKYERVDEEDIELFLEEEEE